MEVAVWPRLDTDTVESSREVGASTTKRPPGGDRNGF